MQPQCQIQSRLNPNLWHHIDAKLFYFLPVVDGTKALAAAARSSYCIGFVMKMHVCCSADGSNWKKNKRISCFEVNTIAMLLFFFFFQSESKNVVFTLLSSVCSAVKKTRAEREASDFLCCTGNSQESHACSAAQQHAGRCAVARFVFSWAVLVGLWKTLSVLSKLCRAVRTRVGMEHSGPFQVLADVGTSIRKLSPNALPVFPVAAVAGTGARMVWDGLGLFDSTALQSQKSFFCFMLFPSSNFVEKVRCSHAFLKTGALKNMNLEPSLLLPLLHTTRWHFRNPIPA